MECPYCGAEMKKGLIQAHMQNKPFKWFAEDDKKKDSFSSWFRGAGGTPVGKCDVMNGARLVVHHCEKCSKMIVDINEN